MNTLDGIIADKAPDFVPGSQKDLDDAQLRRMRELDQFYTRPEVAAACMAIVEEKLAGREVGTWLEPSAGGCVFLDLMPHPRIGLDIDVQRGDVRYEDFLEWAPSPEVARPIVVLGNPPFGKNASLALRFVNRAARFSEFVCMILPRTFEKTAMQAKVAKSHELIHTETLDPDSFLHNGRSYPVPCCFQIWKQLPVDSPRIVERTMLTHCHFDFVENQGATVDEAIRLGVDFAFQRVGGNAGTSSREGLSRSWKSHYWIRANREFTTPEALMDTLNGIDWSEYSRRTAGNPSIGKGELILEYSKIHAHCPVGPRPGTFDFGE